MTLGCVQGAVRGVGSQADLYDIPGHLVVRFCHQLRGVVWQADEAMREAAAALCERTAFYSTLHTKTTLEAYAPQDYELLEG